VVDVRTPPTETPRRPPPPGPPAGHGVMRRGVRLLVVVGFLTFITLPLLVTVAGVRPGSVENRAATEVPDLGGQALLQENTYQALNQYLIDRWAFRGLAVRANAKLNDKVWKTEAAGDVRRGKDDWLYFGPSLRRLCTEALTPTQSLDVLDAFARAIEASGRPFVYALAPEKTSIYPEHLTDRQRNEGSCAFAERDKLRAALADPARTWNVDLYGPLETLKAQSPVPIYHPRDTHWTQRGAAVEVQELVEGLQPGLWQDSELQSTGQTALVPDLTRLLGLPKTDHEEAFTVVRPGVTTTEGPPTPVEGDFSIRHFQSTSTGVPLITGRTVMLYDSFTLPAVGMLAPFFADLTLVHWNVVGKADVAGMLAEADRVVAEGAEREFAWRMGDKVVGTGLLERVEAGLPSRR
jgi:hypothetical protein